MGDRSGIRPSAVDLAYLAGVVDADGYVTATQSQRRGRWYFGAQVGITGSSREPHDLAAAIFGGRVAQHTPPSGHRVQHHWQRGGSGAVPVLLALLPYLRIKLDRAHLALALQDELTELRLAGPDAWPEQPSGYDPTRRWLSAVGEIRGLHARSQAHLQRSVAPLPPGPCAGCSEPARCGVGPGETCPGWPGLTLDGRTHDGYPQ